MDDNVKKDRDHQHQGQEQGRDNKKNPGQAGGDQIPSKHDDPRENEKQNHNDNKTRHSER